MATARADHAAARAKPGVRDFTVWYPEVGAAPQLKAEAQSYELPASP